jgi:hypothetical protein
MISRSFERPDRTARRASVAKKRYKMRYTTPEDRTTSCLVSTHDRISGTHRRLPARDDGRHARTDRLPGPDQRGRRGADHQVL